MGTVLVEYWDMWCVSCGWRVTRRMFAATLGSYDVKQEAIRLHRLLEHYTECPTMDVGIEVEEAHDPIP